MNDPTRSKSFDAYHVWLGIRPDEQPPNHYRLLGIDLFETNEDVIAHAADRQMLYVKQFDAGPHQSASQQLLNEIAAAKRCLLNSGSKASYDAALRESLASSEPPPVPDDVPRPAPTEVSVLPQETPFVTEASVRPASSAHAPTRKRSRHRQRPIQLVLQILAPILGLSLGWLILQWIRSNPQEGVDTSFQTSVDKHASAVDSSAETDRAALPSSDPFDLEKDTAASSISRNTLPSPTLDEPVAPTDDPGSLHSHAEPSSPVENVDVLAAARSDAIARGDLNAALVITDKIAALDSLDSMTAKLAVLEEFQHSVSENNALHIVVDHTIALLDEALDAGRHDLAQQIAEFGLVTARKSNDPILIRRATLAVLKAKESPPNAPLQNGDTE